MFKFLDSGSAVDNILMAMYTRFHHPVSFAIRDALQNCVDFPSAVHVLSSVKLVASCYIIVAGPQPLQGVIITRDRWAAADLWTLSDREDGWYRTETNYDHWNPAPAKDKRRETANGLLKNMTQANLTPMSLFQVLSTPPINNNFTLFSTNMSAKYPQSLIKYTKIRAPTPRKYKLYYSPVQDI